MVMKGLRGLVTLSMVYERTTDSFKVCDETESLLLSLRLFVCFLIMLEEDYKDYYRKGIRDGKTITKCIERGRSNADGASQKGWMKGKEVGKKHREMKTLKEEANGGTGKHTKKKSGRKC